MAKVRYSIKDIKAMSDAEFDIYAKGRYTYYINSITHMDDDMSYYEYWLDLSAQYGRSTDGR